MSKRIFDLVASLLGLALLSPLFAVAALLIKLESRGPVFFRQERIGRKFRPFHIYKFRTMLQDSSDGGPQLTAGEDPRITRVGRYLRSAKIDELPQLLNVLRGDMSLVGPRPEVRRYVEMFRQDYAKILEVRPGITDFASMKYRDEARLLGSAEKPEEEYIRHVLPDKINLGKDYIERASFLLDLKLIAKSFALLFAFGRNGRNG